MPARIGRSPARSRCLLALVLLLLMCVGMAGATQLILNTSNTSDGYIQSSGTNQLFTTLRAGSGSSSDNTSAISYARVSSDSTADRYASIYRGVLIFDGSAIPDDAIIDNVTLYLSESLFSVALGNLGIGVVKFNINGPIQPSGFKNFEFTRFSMDNPITTLEDAGYHRWYLNSLGISNISKTGSFGIGVLTSADIDNSSPTWASSTASHYRWTTAESVTSPPLLNVTYHVDIAPSASFTKQVTNGNGQSFVTFTDTSTGPPNTWNWTFQNVAGNNTVVTFSTVQNPTYLFPVGNYSLTVNVSNTVGYSVSAAQWVNVSIAPIAAFSGTPTSGYSPLPVSFADASTGSPSGWAWFFGDENYTQAWNQQTASAGWQARYGHSSVVMPDGSLILMGGKNTNTKFADVWRSTDNGVTWSLINSNAAWAYNTGRQYASVVVSQSGSIILIGGATSEGTNPFKNDTWTSPDSGVTWTLTNGNGGWVSRDSATSVFLADGKIIMMGGATPDASMGAYAYRNLNDVWQSTNSGLTWSLVNASAGWTAREHHNSVVLPDGNIILLAGMNWDGSKYTYFNDTWRSTDNGTTWAQMNASSGWLPRVSPTTVAMPDGSIVLMGGQINITTGTGAFNDIWRSTDEGKTWTNINTSVGWSTRGYSTSAVVSDGSIILMGGVGVATYNDTWRMQPVGSNAQNPVHTYTNTGTAFYNVSLMVSNAFGSNTLIKSNYIRVDGTPVASFTASPPTVLIPQAVTFIDTSIGSPTTWNYSYGDGQWGNSSVSGTATHSYAAIGTYGVFLIASNGAGSNQSASQLINVTLPITIFNLTNSTPLPAEITWNWNWPTPAPVDEILMIYRNNTFWTNSSNTTTSRTWTDLPNGTAMTFSSLTCYDTEKICNATWVNATATTGGVCPTPTPTPTTPPPTSPTPVVVTTPPGGSFLGPIVGSTGGVASLMMLLIFVVVGLLILMMIMNPSSDIVGMLIMALLAIIVVYIIMLILGVFSFQYGL